MNCNTKSDTRSSLSSVPGASEEKDCPVLQSETQSGKEIDIEIYKNDTVGNDSWMTFEQSSGVSIEGSDHCDLDGSVGENESIDYLNVIWHYSNSCGVTSSVQRGKQSDSPLRDVENENCLAVSSVSPPRVYRFFCSICKRNFASMASLEQHMVTHTGERKYECTLCDRRFAQPGTLRAHTRTHTGERPYSCSLCERKFTQSGSLDTHLRTMHGKNKGAARRRGRVLGFKAVSSLDQLPKPIGQ